jgi:hypothetical protein
LGESLNVRVAKTGVYVSIYAKKKQKTKQNMSVKHGVCHGCLLFVDVHMIESQVSCVGMRK